MITRNIFGLTGGAILAAALAACGGGSGGDGGVAGIDSTGRPVTVATGAITGFGSVIVNGIRYETNGATFMIDGRLGTQSELAVGDVVLVKGDVASGATSGTAQSVTFDDAVEGPIAAIDAANNTFVVLGQLVRVGPDTSFDDSLQPASFAGLVVGNFVEVSGLVRSDGSIGATRIEPKPAGGELELTGSVSNLDSTARRFNINALVVDYSAAAMLQDFPNGAVANGQLIEVKGSTVGAGGTLNATRLEFKGNRLGVTTGDRVEVEGFVTRFVSAADFDVAGVPVTTNAQTIFEGGTAANVGLNVKVEAEGVMSSAGVLVATKVDIRRGSAVRVVAQVDAVNPAARSFVVLGITVRTDSLTRSEDKSSQDVSPFGASNLNVGDYVEVRGAELPAGSGEVLASLLEREDLRPEVELQGFVETIAQPTLEILGVTINTGGGTDFRDVNDAPLNATQFFGAVALGRLVKADGVEISDRAIQADEVELEQ
jgi:hypothetical protein